MLFWIVLAIITAGTLAGVLAPLAWARRDEPRRSAQEIALYRDQLGEIGADLERGQIDTREADAARAEIARRLLRSAQSRDQAVGHAVAMGDVARGRLLLATAALMTVGSVALYLAYGSPGLPGRPFAQSASLPIEGQSIETLIAQVEERLRQQPEDGMGWSVVAPVYMRLGRHSEAVNAYAQSLRLLGETPERLEAFAEASIIAGNGIVGEEARKALDKALASDGRRMKPRFWLGVAAEQDGRLGDARAAYTRLLAETPVSATELRGTLAERLVAVGGSPAPPTNGPSAADLEAAANLTTEQRNEMIRGMVAGLAEKLAANGRDLPGWLQLVRSYAVLGETAKASQALADARKALAGDAKAGAELATLAGSLGL